MPPTWAALFKDHYFIFIRCAQQLVGSCKSGRSSADNYDFFLHPSSFLMENSPVFKLL